VTWRPQRSAPIWKGKYVGSELACEALVDLQVAAVGRKASEADRRGIVDQLQGPVAEETTRQTTASTQPHRY
jgi:hypothetical protein